MREERGLKNESGACLSGWRGYTAIRFRRRYERSMLVLMGAVAGGLVGYFSFFWIARQGFYALVLPGGLLGVGASFFANRWTALCVTCGLLALVLGVLAEWQFAPFITDGSLGYFVTHIHQLKPITLIMIAAGAFIGFWAPFSRRQYEGRG